MLNVNRDGAERDESGAVGSQVTHPGRGQDLGPETKGNEETVKATRGMNCSVL